MTRPTGTGRIGRPPDPIPLQVLKGNRKDRRREMGPVPPELDPEDPPDWLDDDGLALWRRYVPGMVRRKVLRFDDAMIAAAWCQEGALYVRTIGLLSKSGPLVDSRRNGVRKNPLAQVARDHLEKFMALSSKLGMSPVDRARIVADEEYDALGVERLLSDPLRGA